MAQCAIIINVSDQPYTHSNGLSGQYIVPAKGEEDFGILVVYPGREIQDTGSQRKEVHYPKALKIALDIMGAESDASAHVLGARGGTGKWGLLLCSTQPEMSKELEAAIEEEGTFLDHNPPDVKFKYDTINKLNAAVNIESDSVKEEKIRLSDQVVELREKFAAACRKLVKPSEIWQAKKNLQLEDQRLISVADAMYAKGEGDRKNINELHQRACARLGQERPWCYVPKQLVACPGCGAMITDNILTCPSCTGWLEEGIAELAGMKPKERALKMYPERYAEPVGPGKK